MEDGSRCAIHTMTHKPWDLRACCEKFAAAGVAGVGVWRNVVAEDQGGCGLDEAARIVKGSGLAVPAYVRGGFFVSGDPRKRGRAIDDNKRVLDEAAALGAEQVVLVVGAEPGLPLADARGRVRDGIAACLDHAEAAGVRLSIEPLHPMYAATLSCVNRLAEARAMCETLDHAMLGVAVDVYHVWWDPDLEDELNKLGGAGRLFGFHVCDWRVDTRDLRTDRGLMGEGCIDVAGIRRRMDAAGFGASGSGGASGGGGGFAEVEVFSDEHWAEDQDDYLRRVVAAFREHV